MAQGVGGGLGLLVGAGLGIAGAIRAEKTQRRFRRRQRKAIQSAREFAKERVGEITGSDLFQEAESFLTSTFRDAGSSPLAQDFAKQLRAQQAVRGTFSGNVSAAAEAVGTSAFAQRLRGSLLPQALSFAQAPERLRQSILAQEAPLRVAASTGARLPGLGAPQLGDPVGSMLEGALSGASGGFQIGSSFDNQAILDERLQLLREERESETLQPRREIDTSMFSQLSFEGGPRARSRQASFNQGLFRN